MTAEGNTKVKHSAVLEDWAAAIFLADVPSTLSFAPRCYGGNLDEQLLVLEQHLTLSLTQALRAMTQKYMPHSWIEPRLEVRPSPIHGLGSFARTAIKAGEVVTIWGGAVFSLADVTAGKTKPGTVVAIEAAPIKGVQPTPPLDS